MKNLVARYPILFAAITGAFALYGWWLLRRYRRAWGARQAPPAAALV